MLVHKTERRLPKKLSSALRRAKQKQHYYLTAPAAIQLIQYPRFQGAAT